MDLIKDAFELTLRRQKIDENIIKLKEEWREIAERVRSLAQEKHRLQQSIDSVVMKYGKQKTYKIQAVIPNGR